MRLRAHPLTPERWHDFETLFGPRGAYGGCWCMWWRTSRSEFAKQQGEGNRLAMRRLVDAGEIPGIILYVDDQPAGWCSIAPRASYPSLGRSRVLRPIDDTPVWSLVCFFIARAHRGRGLTLRLIQAAIEYVRHMGGAVIEAYPTVVQSGRLAPVSSYMGMPAIFAAAGFVECARPSASKMIMRYTVCNPGIDTAAAAAGGAVRAPDSSPAPASPLYERIYEVVARIPRGRVATYGQVAELAGLARQPRLVGYALRALPEGRDIPWHRVINARGQVSKRAAPGWESYQQALLEDEGVEFGAGDTLSLERYRWRTRARRRGRAPRATTP